MNNDSQERCKKTKAHDDVIFKERYKKKFHIIYIYGASGLGLELGSNGFATRLLVLG